MLRRASKPAVIAVYNNWSDHVYALEVAAMEAGEVGPPSEVVRAARSVLKDLPKSKARRSHANNVALKLKRERAPVALAAIGGAGVAGLMSEAAIPRVPVKWDKAVPRPSL